jgi:hypothetical protein
VKISRDGTTIAASAPGNGTGRALVHEWSSTANDWLQKGNTIQLSTGTNFGTYAMDLSADGNVIAIHSYNRKTISGTESYESEGSVYVYEYNSSTFTWDLINNSSLYTTVSGIGNNNYGASLALSDDGYTIAICIPKYSYIATENIYWGQVEVHTYSNGSWTQKGSDIIEFDTDAAVKSYYGSFVVVDMSSDGNKLIFGSMDIGIEGNYTQLGYVKYYEYINSDWVQTVKTLVHPSPASSRAFGYGVGLSENGNKAVIGGNKYARTYDFTTL